MTSIAEQRSLLRRDDGPALAAMLELDGVPKTTLVTLATDSEDGFEVPSPLPSHMWHVTSEYQYETFMIHFLKPKRSSGTLGPPA